MKGDIQKFPKSLEKYVREIFLDRYQGDIPIYRVEYHMYSKHVFKEDFDNFFNKIRPILSKNKLEIIER